MKEYVCSASTNVTGTESTVQVSTVSTVCTLEGLEGGVRYTFAVTAVNSVSASAPVEITVCIPGMFLYSTINLCRNC